MPIVSIFVPATLPKVISHTWQPNNIQQFYNKMLKAVRLSSVGLSQALFSSNEASWQVKFSSSLMVVFRMGLQQHEIESMVGALHHKPKTTGEIFFRSDIAESSWKGMRPSKAVDTSGFRLRGRVWLQLRVNSPMLGVDQPDPTGHSGCWTQRCAGGPVCTTGPRREKTVRQQ